MSDDSQILADMDRAFEASCVCAVAKLELEGITLTQLGKYSMENAAAIFQKAGASRKEASALNAILSLGMMALARKGFEKLMSKE